MGKTGRVTRFAAALLAAALALVCACAPSSSSSFTVSYWYPSSQTSGSDPYVSGSAGVVPVPYHDPNIVSDFERVSTNFRYEALEEGTQRELYKALAAAMLDGASETRPVRGTLTDDQVKEVYKAVLDDFPQFFEADDRYTVNRTSGVLNLNKSIYLTISYIAQSTEEIMSRREEFYGRVNDILLGAREISDPLERQQYFYDTVISSAEYDFAELETMGLDMDTHTAYGCLVKGKTVCDGYAKAFMLLCCCGGIECRTVDGYTSGSRHSWAAVNIGGKYFFCDPTPDDVQGKYLSGDNEITEKPTDIRIPDTASHLYFNLTYRETAPDHIFADRLPDAADFPDSRLPAGMESYTDTESLETALGSFFRLAASGASFEFAARLGMKDAGRIIASAAESCGAFSGRYVYFSNGAESRYCIIVI